jgi:hypothetical protein
VQDRERQRNHERDDRGDDEREAVVFVVSPAVRALVDWL